MSGNVIKIPGSDIACHGPGDMAAFMQRTISKLANSMMLLQSGMEQIAGQTNEISTKNAIESLLEKVRNS